MPTSESGINGEGETDCLPRQSAIIGCLLGTAIGDAYALPYEGLAPSRIQKIFQPGGYHFFFGKDMVSDDTEHAVMTAQALMESGGDIEVFRQRLAWKMRIWILLLPAGVGFATLRSCLKLWLSFSPRCEGVFSAGNGPMMRSPIIGVYCGGDINSLKKLVRVSTRLTHTDPRAEHGAVAVALAARMSAQGVSDVTAYLEQLRATIGEEGAGMLEIVRKSADMAGGGVAPEEFAERFRPAKKGQQIRQPHNICSDMPVAPARQGLEKRAG
jgi:ADP-ribosylglycohydrolase